MAQSKESTCQYRRHGFYHWVGKIPWRRKWQPTQLLLPGKSHGQRSLVGYSPWDPKESDTTLWLNNNNFGYIALKYLFMSCTWCPTLSPFPVQHWDADFLVSRKTKNRTANFNLQSYCQRQDLDLSDWENVLFSSPPHSTPPHTHTHTHTPSFNHGNAMVMVELDPKKAVNRLQKRPRETTLHRDLWNPFLTLLFTNCEP